MKIVNNNAGNYSPLRNRTIDNSLNQLNKTTSSSQKIDKAQSTNKPDLITAKEKNFFVNKYPNKKDEIMDYHFYKRNGKMAGVKIGSLIDKRG